MTTYTALTTLPGKEQADALGTAIEALGPTGVGVFKVEDGSGLWEVGGYFEAPPDEAALAVAAAAFGAAPFAVSALPETDWVAHVRRELAPVEAGRFFVYGSHDAENVPEGRIALLIEAAMAFGTGHHGTTLGCLEAYDALLNEGTTPRTVLDLGCGTAVLAMAAARTLPGAQIIASDIDPVAVDVAEANLAANDLRGTVTCLEATGLENPVISGAAPYDLIFANILKGPLIDLAPVIAESINSGGQVILSGILNEQADEVSSVYSSFGFNQISRSSIVEWTTLRLQKFG